MARTRVKRPECPNCGRALEADANFCAHCGQENHTHKLPVRHFVVEWLSGMFNFDTKLLRTLRDLFWPPGLVIREFNANKRIRYVHPLRPRTLTPHEAARVQFIPDFFTFPETGRK